MNNLGAPAVRWSRASAQLVQSAKD